VYSLAVHYRHSRAKKLARARIEAAVARLDRVRAIPGKCVVNLVPDGAPHKGTALETARAQLGCERALYVGDDDTDEDVFALGDPDRLLTIRVGRKERSRAAYFIRDQRAIDALLGKLAALRACTRPEPARRARRR
jgi:trehalose 6-phosphate phosphatase